MHAYYWYIQIKITNNKLSLLVSKKLSVDEFFRHENLLLVN